jgi:hypothetical protein
MVTSYLRMQDFYLYVNGTQGGRGGGDGGMERGGVPHQV